MSPQSRGRKGNRNKKSVRVSAPPVEVCDCPECSGEELDPQAMFDDLTSGFAELASEVDPLEAEVGAAMVLAIGDTAGDQFDQMLRDGLVPDLAARGDAGALGMLLAIGAVDEGESGAAARAAADRVVAAGTAAPQWEAELHEPVTVGECLRLYDAEQTASVLSATFHRAGRSHAFVMMVNHLHCGAADELLLVPQEAIPATLDTLRAQGGVGGVKLAEEVLEPAEFRWQAECALDARAVHDEELLDIDPDEDPTFDEDGPGYPAAAILLQARLAALPELDRSKPPHHDGDLMLPVQLLLRSGDQVEPLPAGRTIADGPAPVYRLRVDLRGAKPPIWRRLEVPADIDLADLHNVLQTAFAWEDVHLHVFQTPYGEFGIVDTELGHQPEEAVTLEQVAPRARSKLRYTYDFGDDWDHEIVVEKVLDPDPAGLYPRCTGGRRAAPPEDCGGVWGYADLVESGEVADPAAFDPAAVTRRLT